MFRGKTLLITGGTGSFGCAVVSRFIKTNIKEIRIFSRDEKKQEDLRIKLKNDKVKFYIGDVRDYGSILNAMGGVDYVFHAAALKQVPSCEFYPMEAVKTNVLGTENVLNSAIFHEVSKVIILSTDKAVYPINAMGMSKALAEKAMIAKSRTIGQEKTILCGTRYGNVMASRGSVIPLFIKQIVEKKIVTITDPMMTRFLMSLDDAVNLVLFAFEHGEQGDMFVQKAPASTIGNLATAIQKFLNVEGVKIEIIGTRHGEKLFETLLTREELTHAYNLGKYYRIPADNRDLNYKKFFANGEIQVSLATDYNSQNTAQLTIPEIINLLKSLYKFPHEIIKMAELGEDIAC